MSQTNNSLVDVFADFAPGFPGVAHMVADLDDLFIGTPLPRLRRASLFRRMKAAISRVVMYRRLAASGVIAIVMAVAA